MLISYFLILGCVYWNTLLIGNPIDNSLIVSSSACFIYIGTEPGRFTLTNSFPIYVKCIWFNLVYWCLSGGENRFRGSYSIYIFIYIQCRYIEQWTIYSWIKNITSTNHTLYIILYVILDIAVYIINSYLQVYFEFLTFFLYIFPFRVLKSYHPYFCLFLVVLFFEWVT